MVILDEYIQEIVEKKYLSYYYNQFLPHDYEKVIDAIIEEIRKYNYYKGKINSGLGDLEIYVQTDVDYITTLTQ